MVTLETVRRAWQLLGDKRAIVVNDLTSADQTQLRDIFEQTDPTRLSREDLWAVLSDDATAPSIQTEIRNHFFYQENNTNTEGIHLDFRRVSVRAGTGQVAYVSIQPSSQVNMSLPPIFFLGGLLHPSRMYFEAMRRLAIRTGRSIYLIDNQGMGGSVLPEGTGVAPESLRESVTAVLHQEMPQGGDIVLMGHSLGTIPLKRFFNHPEELNTSIAQYTIVRDILITPVPSQEDQRMGYFLDRQFALGFLGAIAVTFGNVQSTAYDYFFDSRNLDREWAIRIMQSEAYETNYFQTIRTFFDSYASTTLDQLIQGDPRLEVIFAEDDHLMHLTNQENWSGRRGVTVVPHADHSFLVGNHVSENIIDLLATSLQATESHRPSLDRQSLYRIPLWERNMGAELLYNNDCFGAGVFSRLGARYGIYRTDSLGLFLSIGGRFNLAYQGDHWTSVPHTYTELMVEPLRLPFATFGVGASVGAHIVWGERDVAPQISAYGIARLVDLEAFRFSVEGGLLWEPSDRNGQISYGGPFVRTMLGLTF